MKIMKTMETMKRTYIKPQAKVVRTTTRAFFAGGSQLYSSPRLKYSDDDEVDDIDR